MVGAMRFTKKIKLRQVTTQTVSCLKLTLNLCTRYVPATRQKSTAHRLNNVECVARKTSHTFVAFGFCGVIWCGLVTDGCMGLFDPAPGKLSHPAIRCCVLKNLQFMESKDLHIICFNVFTTKLSTQKNENANQGESISKLGHQKHLKRVK